VISPFEQIAPQYAALWSDTRRGRVQRERVWREIDVLFQPGDRILDLGCGTGDDAVHLRSRDVEVLGIDSASRMVEIGRNRGVDARTVEIEDLSSLDETFDGAISNFGALNCVADLGEVSRALAKVVRPQGNLALCVMSRFCWRNDWEHLPQRWRGHARWHGMDVYYRTARAIERVFAPYFDCRRRVSIGRGDHKLLLFTRRPEC
jgi:ubiquinone/menaquinone biosynthesis C-methylase UbiE